MKRTVIGLLMMLGMACIVFGLSGCGADPEVIQGPAGANGARGSDGNNGQDGDDAPATPFTPVGLIDPCGDAAGVHDEVFIRMVNGDLVGLFANNFNGDYPRLIVVVDGSYVTSDSTACNFTVATVGSTRTLSWTTPSAGSVSWTVN